MFTPFTRLLSISTLTQLADEIVSAKIVLPWILLSLSAPLWMLALIVPIKESGALLPQWSVQKMLAQRFSTAGIWRSGMLLQGAALMSIATLVLWPTSLSVGFLSSLQFIAAYGVLLGVVVLSLGRALCSFTIKDIQAHNVEKGRRGKLIGAGGSAAGLVTIMVAVLLFQWGQSGPWGSSGAQSHVGAKGIPDQMVLGLLVIAGCICYGLGLLLSINKIGNIRVSGGLTMPEAPLPARMPFDKKADKKADNKANNNPAAESLWHYFSQEKDLRELIISRVLLMHGALVLPFMVILIAERYIGISSLALVMLSAAIASFLSSYIWGWFSDYSARATLAIAAAGCVLSIIGLFSPWGLANLYVAGAVFLLMNLCYSGIRTARKTYLIDMVIQAKRQRYVAAGNTIVGCVLLILGSVYAGLFSVDLTTNIPVDNIADKSIYDSGMKIWVIGWCGLMLCLGMLHTRRLRYDSQSDE
ncbi:MAG: hypothetical protein P8J70_01425 [Glaciecola sp.]|jgi:hypothetical protein|nr:hypothetical protein [Glaciecola sp.]MDG1816047.1 hypothetical protein [Glaciecola sp.]MDG2098325.1 hypothetical protein [Glaciecola sp.]